jgi:hypothetical protein
MVDNRKDATHPSEVVTVPKQHRLSLNFNELDEITGLVIRHTEKVTDRAFSENRTTQDVADAVFWRGLSRRLQERRDLADSRE